MHYTSTGSDKEYLADAQILKAVGSNGISIFSASKKMDLLNLPRETLEKMYLEMFTNEIIRETLH